MRVSQSFEEFMDKLRERLHPHHFSQIMPANAMKWWVSLDSDTEHDEIWHMNRLGNKNGPTIGGSEIGALVADEFNEPAPFALTPSVLFDRKTLALPLQPTNPAMSFGNHYEPVARYLFEQEYTVARDHAALDRLSSVSRLGEVETLAYSPDDIFILPDGSRALIDYKSPFTGVVPEPTSIPLGYASQLHQGKLALEDLGFKIDHLILVYLSHPKSLCRPKEAGITVFNVGHDQSITDTIIRRSAIFAESVMDGENPGHVWLSVEKREELAAMDAELTQLRRDLETMEARRRVIEQSMSKVVVDLSKAQLAEIQLEMTPVTRLSVTSGEDVSLYLENQDASIKEYQSPSNVMDMDAVWTAFESMAKKKGQELVKKDFIKPVLSVSDLDAEILFSAFSAMAEDAGQPVVKSDFMKPILDVPGIFERYPELVGLGVINKSVTWAAPRSSPKPKASAAINPGLPANDESLSAPAALVC